jgi:transposase
MRNFTLKEVSIGLDVSKDTISVYIPKLNLNHKIDNSVDGIKKLISKLKKLYKKAFDNLVFVYEPTGSYSELLRKFCAKKSIKTFIINPKRSCNFAKANGNRNKTDIDDAKVLSEAIVLAKDEDIVIPVINSIAENIKELMSYYKFIVKQRVMAINHLESIKAKDGSDYIFKSLKKEILLLKEKEKEIIAKIRNLILKDQKLSNDYNNIKSITGIGELGAIVLLHMFLKYPDANKRQLVSLAGLDPTKFDSGSSIHKRTKISKAGSKLYRGVLFMGTMIAIRYNEEMKLFYDRLKANGKQTTQAQIAVMRKMIVIAHSLYKNNQKYDSEIYKKACGMK